MSRKIQDLIDEVRRLRVDRDASSYRMSDEELASLATDYFAELFRTRPDAYVPYSQNTVLPQVTPATFSDPWPVGEQFFRPGTLYILGYSELADDEHANSGRAAQSIAQARQMLEGAV